MTVHEITVLFAAYCIPLFFLLYMAIDVFVRNPKKPEHFLVSLNIFSYALMFLGEYVRHLLPIEYSPVFVAFWFGNAGLLNLSVGIHFLAKITKFNKKMPRYMYPYVFYIPLIPVILTMINRENIFNSQQFVEIGVWKVPVFNAEYYITLTAANVISALFILVLVKGRENAEHESEKRILNLLISGIVFVFVWDIVFGYINFQGMLPPYPYIYAGVVWCFFLRLSMIKHDFLSSYSKRYEILFNLNPAPIFLINQSGKIKEANPSAQQLIGRENLQHLTFTDFLLPVSREQWEQQFLTHFKNQEKFINIETVVQSANEGEKYVLVDGDYVFVENSVCAVLIMRDITEQKQNEEKITFLAYHDPLTKLPNRRYFYEKLELAMQKASANKEKLAVVLIDLDYFKEINDQYGHNIGDEFLCHASSLIQRAVTNHGLAARLGGDEFVFYLDKMSTIAGIDEYIHHFYDRLAEHPFIVNGKQIPVCASIGVSFFPEDGEDSDTLMNSADQAMYERKRKRKQGGHARKP